MLKRIYIDNYKSCVDFTLDFGPINLLMGINGSGKSTVFEVLRHIRNFVTDGRTINQYFTDNTLTRWQSSRKQSFRLEIERPSDNGLFRYELGVAYGQERKIAYVEYEKLFYNDNAIVTYEATGDDDRGVTLYDDSHRVISEYPLSLTGSVLTQLKERKDTTKLNWFKERLARFIIVQITPHGIWEDAAGESSQLSKNAHNFVDWYRFISHDQEFVNTIKMEMQEIYTEFDGFELRATGEQNRLLWSRFRENGHYADYRFSELSEGQRVLIVLYTIIHFAKSKDYTICIDEPDNYVALPEIQPWLISLEDLCDDDQLQALLISHHPELINYLVPSRTSIWFQKEGSFSPTHIKPLLEHDELGVSASELVARGWIGG